MTVASSLSNFNLSATSLNPACDNPSTKIYSPHGRNRPAVLPPISTEGVTSSHDDIQALTDKTRNAMLEAIEDLGRKRQEQLQLSGSSSSRKRDRVTASAGVETEVEGERTRLLQPTEEEREEAAAVASS